MRPVSNFKNSNYFGKEQTSQNEHLSLLTIPSDLLFIHYKLRHISFQASRAVVCLIRHPVLKTPLVLGRGGTAPSIPKVGTRWKWVISFMVQTLCPQGNIPRQPSNRRMCGPQKRSGRFWGTDKYLVPSRSQTQERPTCSLVTILTELSRLLATSCTLPVL